MRVLMCNFSETFPFLYFWDKFHPKICCSPYLLKFIIAIPRTDISQNKLEEASQQNLFYIVFIILVLDISRFKSLCVCICICICIWSHVQTPCTVHPKLLNTILREFNVLIRPKKNICVKGYMLKKLG